MNLLDAEYKIEILNRCLKAEDLMGEEQTCLRKYLLTTDVTL